MDFLGAFDQGIEKPNVLIIVWRSPPSSLPLSSQRNRPDEGGTIYEGKAYYPSIKAALKDLEKHLKANMEDRGYEFD